MSLSEIQQRIVTEEARTGREGATRLIAVSKVQPNARVQAVLDEGHRVFGENKVRWMRSHRCISPCWQRWPSATT